MLVMENLKVYHNPGEIVSIGEKKKLMYLDQLKEDIVYIGCYKFKKYIKSMYNLTIEEYYNLVTTGDKDSIHICKNKNCNNIVKFDRLSEGYNSCCCRKCNGKYVADLLIKEGRLEMNKPEFRKLAILSVKKMHEDGSHSFNTVEVHARSRMTDFIRKSLKSGKTMAYVYYAECNDPLKFKIGITCDISNYNGLMNLHGYKSMTEIARGDIRHIAEIEYNIKIHFNQRIEYYDISRKDEILNYIESIK